MNMIASWSPLSYRPLAFFLCSKQVPVQMDSMASQGCQCPHFLSHMCYSLTALRYSGFESLWIPRYHRFSSVLSVPGIMNAINNEKVGEKGLG